MNRHSLRLPVLILLSVFTIISCKKTNTLNPYPNNYRLLNVTRTATPSLSSLQIVNENYRFVYDNYNRVTQVVYTTNNAAASNTISYLTYVEDTIFKTTRFVNETLAEKDTFISDLRGHITKSYILGQVTKYAYLVNLLSRVDYNDTNYVNYTSYNGNFLAAVSSLGPAYKGTFEFFTDKPNRNGDYLQLLSMFKFGQNIYQNSSLVRNITVPGTIADITYVIDADNKVTKTTAVVTDSSGSYHTDVYQMQYETY
ncbi:MAG: hypothetical protein H7257_07710 [Taibaiella sp.]|nr:hypothetical protein [Taibaiella sp.]